MINANELRIGNFVLDQGGKMIKIDFFEHLGKGYSCKFGQHSKAIDDWGPLHPLTEYTDYANPIPLTPEILEKCGFKYIQKTVYTIDNKISFAVFNGKLSTTYVCLDNAINQIKYLHELQNLYFALTGIELNINL